MWIWNFNTTSILEFAVARELLAQGSSAWGVGPSPTPRSKVTQLWDPDFALALQNNPGHSPHPCLPPSGGGEARSTTCGLTEFKWGHHFLPNTPPPDTCSPFSLQHQEMELFLSCLSATHFKNLGSNLALLKVHLLKHLFRIWQRLNVCVFILQDIIIQ